jgi:hypothetical protein
MQRTFKTLIPQIVICIHRWIHSCWLRGIFAAVSFLLSFSTRVCQRQKENIEGFFFLFYFFLLGETHCICSAKIWEIPSLISVGSYKNTTVCISSSTFHYILIWELSNINSSQTLLKYETSIHVCSTIIICWRCLSYAKIISNGSLVHIISFLGYVFLHLSAW